MGSLGRRRRAGSVNVQAFHDIPVPTKKARKKGLTTYPPSSLLSANPAESEVGKQRGSRPPDGERRFSQFSLRHFLLLLLQRRSTLGAGHHLACAREAPGVRNRSR